jgi:hypothetical protein
MLYPGLFQNRVSLGTAHPQKNRRQKNSAGRRLSDNKYAARF